MTEIREQITSSIEASNTSLSVIERPFIADRKEKPKRSIIVITALLLSFVIAILGALAVEEIKAISKEL
jgi:uncharacterized protein involved in exopolysaccharide biosynthesis